MKTIGLLFFVIVLFTSCPDPWYWDEYSEYQPILMSRTQLESSISYTMPRVIASPGKIYYKDNYIYINEKYEGVHVINNQNPTAPVNIGFITIPGCIDMAMKFDVLYADNSIDLVAINLANLPSNAQVTKRLPSVFPDLLPPDGKTLKTEFQAYNRPKNTVIVGWEKIKKN